MKQRLVALITVRLLDLIVAVGMSILLSIEFVQPIGRYFNFLPNELFALQMAIGIFLGFKFKA